MKRHSAIGAEMLEALPAYQDEPLVRASHDICRWHHERWDGRGYPDGLKGEEIPIGAQVVALADVYDALTSERVYKPAYSHEKAVEMILNGECGAFNPLLMEVLRESHQVLREQVQSSSYEGSPKSDMRNMAEELIDSKGLEDSENVLKRLEYERAKSKFFGSLSQEILLDYDAKSMTLKLSPYGAKLFQIDEVEMDPYGNPRLKECIESDSIRELTRQVRATSPKSPYLSYDGQLIIDGKILDAHFECMTHWNVDAQEEYLGVAARINLI
jgi:putative two-component system response regulator